MAQLPEDLNLPPPATPSSPLDDSHAPPHWSPHHEFYTPRLTQSHPQDLPNQNPDQIPSLPRVTFDAAETASIASTALPPAYHDSATDPRPQGDGGGLDGRYGSHKSEADYLSALRAWAESKQWVELEGRQELHGFYGDESLESRSKRMNVERRKRKEAKARAKAEDPFRRGTVDAGIVGRSDTVPSGNGVEGQREQDKRKGSVSQWWAKRRQSNAI